MRLLDLQLLAFGPFTNINLNLADDWGKLSIVYGPNEAGKSSSLRAISAALFGIPQQSRDNFLHEYKEMRVGAVLQSSIGANGAGEPFHYIRRKGKKSTILDPASGKAFPENALAPFVGSMDSETFESMYAINYEELERGGRQMQELKGLVGESLFAAGLGTGNLLKVATHLDKEAAELFGKSKRKTTIATARKAYDEANKQKRDSATSSARWQEQAKRLEKARIKRDQVVRQMDQVRKQQSRLQRIRNSLSLLAKRRALSEELAALGEVAELPESYSAEQRAATQLRLEEETKAITALKKQLDGDDGLRQRLSSISLSQGLLENEAAIQSLQQRLGAVLKAANDRDNNLTFRQRDLVTQLRRAVQNAAPELLSAVDQDEPRLDDLQALRVSSDRVLAIQSLGNRQATVEQQLAEQNKAQQNLVRQMSELQQSLERRPDDADISELQRAFQSAAKAGDVSTQIEAKQEALAKLRTQSEEELARLGLWEGKLDDLVRLPVPAAETIDRFEDDLRSARAHRSSLEATSEEVIEELQQIERTIQSLEETLGVATDVELRDHRSVRDQLWQQIQRAWLHGDIDANRIAALCGDPSVHASSAAGALAACFAEELRQTDKIADGLREKASEAAQLTNALARKKQLLDKQTLILDKIATVTREQARIETEWRDIWAACEITPLPPREMRAWCKRHDSLIQLANQTASAETELRIAREQEVGFAKAIRDQLETLGVRLDSTRLPGLLELADARITEQTRIDAQAKTEKKSLQRLQRQADEVAELYADAQTQRNVWQQQWSASMQQLGLAETASAAQANQRLHERSHIGDLIDKIEDIQQRSRHIDEHIDSFNQDVRALVGQIAPNLADLPPTQAATRLQTQLAANQKDQVSVQRLKEQIDALEESLNQKTAQQRQLTQQLSHFHQLAGTNEAEDLSALEASSSQLVNCRRALGEIEEQILQLGAGMSLDEISAEADKQNVDELEAELARTGDELLTIQQDRDEAVAHLRELERACEISDTTSIAAEADQRAVGILTRIHADAERYVKLRAASAILRHQIEKHRAENQDPILARASDLFSRITCNEFKELRTEYDESDQATIVAIRSRGDKSVTVDAMSGGTRDQLYLALRLGYLEARISEHPMPLVIDDILVEFDNDRASATLAVLSELSEQTQVVFFTHHAHLVELAHGSIAGHFNVHYLRANATVESDSTN